MQETFLAQLFNCRLQQRQIESFAIQDAAPAQPDFEATDSDCQLSSSSAEFFQSGSSRFAATDDDEVVSKKQETNKGKRDYATRRKEEVQFLGRTVCVRACARLLGVGQTTIHNIRSGRGAYTKSAGRRKLPVHPTFGFAMRGDVAEKWPSVVMFPWFVYHSAAECMPTDSLHKLKKPEAIKEAAFVEDRDPDLSARHINHFVRTLQTYNSDIEVHLIGPGSFKGERRYLQHGSRTDFFLSTWSIAKVGLCRLHHMARSCGSPTKFLAPICAAVFYIFENLMSMASVIPAPDSREK